MKKALLIIAAVLVVSGAALFLFAFFRAGFDITKLGTGKYETNTYTVNENFGDIEIDTGTTNVVFKKSEDGKFSVVCEELENANHSVAVEDGTLKVLFSDKRSWIERISFFTKTLTMTVFLPEKEYGALTVATATGSVTIPDSFSFGEIAVRVGTGSVLCDASADGTIDLKASTGSIALRGAQAEKITLASSTGSVTLKETVAADELNVKTSTGSVRFERCDAGKITVGTSTGSVTGTLLTDKIFSASSSTGSVRVPESKSGGTCEIKTSTGSVDIKIAD